jgi:nucleotide-binding universal stress UspA family protein
MPRMSGPLVIGFDGSDSAAHAVRTAPSVLNARSALIVVIWEPALASLPIAGEGLVGIDMPLDPQSAELLDEVSTERSRHVATQGVAIAREVGLDAQALTLPDELNVAETLAQVAAERGASAIVVGSHGHGALHTRVLGSTSTKLLTHARCPIVVIPAPAGDQP